MAAAVAENKADRPDDAAAFCIAALAGSGLGVRGATSNSAGSASGSTAALAPAGPETLAEALARAKDSGVGHPTIGAAGTSPQTTAGLTDGHAASLSQLEAVVADLKRDLIGGKRPVLGEHRRVGRMHVEVLEKACEGLRMGLQPPAMEEGQRPEVTIEYLALSHVLGQLPEDDGMEHLLKEAVDHCAWVDAAPPPAVDAPPLALAVAAVVGLDTPQVVVDDFVRYHRSIGFARVLLMVDSLGTSSRDTAAFRQLPGTHVVEMTEAWWAAERSRSRVLVRADARKRSGRCSGGSLKLGEDASDWELELELADALDAGDRGARRCVAAEAAVREAQALGLDWMLLLDDRELLYCPGGDAQVFFASVPWWAQACHFHNFEAVPEPAGAAAGSATGSSCFTESTLFKVNRHHYEDDAASPFSAWLADPLCGDPWGAKCAFGAMGIRHLRLEKALLPLAPGRARSARELGIREEDLHAAVLRARPAQAQEEKDVDPEPSLFPEVVALFFNGNDSGRSACRLGLAYPPVADGPGRFRGDCCELDYVTAGGASSPVVLSYGDADFAAWRDALVHLDSDASNFDGAPPRSAMAGAVLRRRGDEKALAAFYQRWFASTPEELTYLQRCGLVRRIEGAKRRLEAVPRDSAPAGSLSVLRPRPPASTERWLDPSPPWPQPLPRPGPRQVAAAAATVRAGPSEEDEALGSLSGGEVVAFAEGPALPDASDRLWVQLVDRPGWALEAAFVSAERVPVARSPGRPEVFEAVD